MSFYAFLLFYGFMEFVRSNERLYPDAIALQYCWGRAKEDSKTCVGVLPDVIGLSAQFPPNKSADVLVRNRVPQNAQVFDI